MSRVCIKSTCTVLTCYFGVGSRWEAHFCLFTPLTHLSCQSAGGEPESYIIYGDPEISLPCSGRLRCRRHHIRALCQSGRRVPRRLPVINPILPERLFSYTYMLQKKLHEVILSFHQPGPSSQGLVICVGNPCFCACAQLGNFKHCLRRKLLLLVWVSPGII